MTYLICVGLTALVLLAICIYTKEWPDFANFRLVLSLMAGLILFPVGIAMGIVVIALWIEDRPSREAMMAEIERIRKKIHE